MAPVRNHHVRSHDGLRTGDAGCGIARGDTSRIALLCIEDVVPFIRHLVSDGRWITGQPSLINGGYTTK